MYTQKKLQINNRNVFKHYVFERDIYLHNFFQKNVLLGFMDITV